MCLWRSHQGLHVQLLTFSLLTKPRSTAIIWFSRVLRTKTSIPQFGGRLSTQVLLCLCHARGIRNLMFLAELVASESLPSGRAFTLSNFKSITFEGLWFTKFKRFGDGMHDACFKCCVTFALLDAFMVRCCLSCSKLWSNDQKLLFYRKWGLRRRKRFSCLQLELEHHHSRQCVFKPQFERKRRRHSCGQEIKCRHSSQFFWK